MTETRNINISVASILKVFLVLLGVGFLYLIRDILALVFVAWVLASAFFPAVDWFYRQFKIPRPLGLAVMYLVIGGGFLVVLILLLPVVVDQFKQLAGVFPEYIHQFNQWWVGFTHSTSPLPDLENISQTTNIASNLLNTIFGVFSTVLSILMVMVMTFYFTASENSLRRGIMTLLPDKYSPYVTQMLTRVQYRLGMWLRGQLILSILVGALVFVGLTILGVKYALLLALLAAVLEIVPFIGPVIAGAIAAILTLSISQSLPTTLLVIGLYIVVQQLENNLITPKVLGGAIAINPLWVIIAILVGAKIGGVVGALIAVPVVAVLGEILKDVWGKREEPAKSP